MSGIQEPRHGGTNAPRGRGSVPQPAAESGGGGGLGGGARPRLRAGGGI